MAYQNVGMISLDGNDICNRNSANLNHTKGMQRTWLDTQLARFRGDPTIGFIVVYLHHATYSTSNGGGADSVAQQKWAPVFDKFYKDAPETYLGNENTGGTPTMRCYKKNSASSADTKVAWSRVRYRGYGLSAVDVTPKSPGTPARMLVRALDEDGVLTDEITLRRPSN